MLSGHRSAWRRRGRNGRAARIAVPLAIPMALGLTLGVVLAVSGGSATTINQSALGSCAAPSGSPAPSASPAPAVSAAPAPCATPSASASADPKANAVVPPAPSFANGPTALRSLGDLATNPVDGTGAAINLTQTAAQAAASMNCTLTVPAHPLSAKGLATPWQLGDGCSMANAGTEGAFVEATILSPGGQLQVYNPLVITAGSAPAATPVPPTIAPGSVVIIDVGFNGTNLVLQGRGARQGNCIDALGQSLIGQVSACNAVNFYRRANAEIANGTLAVPGLGVSADGQPCLTVRDFAVVDQDQSDNVITSYLLNANGQTAQNTTANAAALAGAQTLNELSARVNQHGVIALVPPNDEMTLVGGQSSIAKTNVYRSLVDQPLLGGHTNAAQVAADYCQNMANIQPARNQLDMTRELNFGSPVPAVGNNLATFMGNRLAMSFANLGCANFGLTDPATVTLDGNQVATAVTYNLAEQTAAAQGPATTGGASGSGGGPGGPPSRHHRHGHRHQNPSFM